MGDAHEAEDAVQDAFLRCLEKAPDFESPAQGEKEAFLHKGSFSPPPVPHLPPQEPPCANSKSASPRF
ncbi:RNA polymerase sigma factor [Bilophila wadsworthia]|uniref:RNA polymerase sigma factor n=1 Tax=Bilophila wadsworthia TaxID=35833 RepID=UPI003AB2618E